MVIRQRRYVKMDRCTYIFVGVFIISPLYFNHLDAKSKDRPPILCIDMQSFLRELEETRSRLINNVRFKNSISSQHMTPNVGETGARSRPGLVDERGWLTYLSEYY